MTGHLRRKVLFGAGALLVLLALPRPAAAQETADLVVSKDDGISSLRVAEQVTYTIVVTNAGPATATGVNVTDNFPATLTGCRTTSESAGEATGNTAGPFDGDITESGLTIPAGGSVTYTSSCTVASAGDGTLSNTATVDATTEDPSPANNAASDADTIAEERNPLDTGGGCGTAGAGTSALALLLPLVGSLALHRRGSRAQRSSLPTAPI